MDFIYKNKLKITMENKTENNSSGFFDVFLSKLKEQSFIIVLMLGVVYFQNKMFTDRITNHRETEKQQQEYINKLVDDERARLIERENYLIEQRDKYVEDALNKLNK
jgi:hypothetical protein